MASSELVGAVEALAAEFGLELDPEAVERFGRHFELLVTWNRKLNLTRITDPAEAARRHFLESVYLTRLVARPATLVDVGSGAGFPGLPIAAVWPDVETILVEPLVKRAVFLKEAARALGLARVSVVDSRFDPSLVPAGALLTARALDGFRELLPALLSSRAGTIALFSEPDLLERAVEIAPERAAVLWALPGADRRLVGLFTARGHAGA